MAIVVIKYKYYILKKPNVYALLLDTIVWSSWWLISGVSISGVGGCEFESWAYPSSDAEYTVNLCVYLWDNLH